MPTPKIHGNQYETEPCPFQCPEGGKCASVGNLHRLHRCRDKACACHDEWRAYFDSPDRIPAPASDALEVA